MEISPAHNYHDIGTDVVLQVDGLYKKFCRSLKHSMYYGMIDSVRSMLGIPYETGVLRKNEFWAVENISFELHKGEALGIVGINGSGKSTLLRLVTGIFPPDKGHIAFKGRIGALIAVGAGFHPHMTGRENIYLNGTILGMTRRQLYEKLDEIIAFADIGDFLDAPVNTYSSGMRVRLGFAIAVHCEPDILLVDEVLSVGDLSFRNKSMRKMAELREQSNALIFISHNLEQIRVLCGRVLVIDCGRIVFEGASDEAILFYEESARKKRAENSNQADYKLLLMESEVVRVVHFGLLGENGREVDNIGFDEPLHAFIDFEVKRQVSDLSFSFALRTEDNCQLLWLRSDDFSNYVVQKLEPGVYRQEVCIEHHHLGAGVYFLSFGISNSHTHEGYLKMHTRKSFFVRSQGHKLERSFINVDEAWKAIKNLQP